MSTKELVDSWRKAFKEIYSSTPYKYSLLENADNLFQYWDLTWNLYMSFPNMDPLNLLNLIWALIYIVLSIFLHLLTITLILPISAIFLSYDQPIHQTLNNWINESAIGIQSIHFALIDMVVHTLMFCLSILLKPFKFFSNFNTETADDAVLRN